MWSSGCLIYPGQLAWKGEQACKLLSMMVHDAIERIAAKSHSQRMCSFTDLRVSTWGSGHHQFSLDLISLILWLSAPNFADRLTRWLQTCFMQQTCLESTLKMVLQKRTYEWRRHCRVWRDTSVPPGFWLALHWPRIVWSCLWNFFVAEGNPCGRFCGWARGGGSAIEADNFNFLGCNFWSYCL